MENEAFIKHFVEVDLPLRTFLFAATRDVHETNDLLQTVWTILWRKFDQYDPARPFKAWAFGIARLEVLKWRQRKARSKEVLSEDVLELLADTAEERSGALNLRYEFLPECLGRLKAVWRRLLQLRYGEELANARIAAAMNRSEAAIEMMLVRARRSLRDCIEKKTKRALRSVS